MRKVIIALITLLIIGVLGYFLIPVQPQRKKHTHSEALNAVPKHAAYILRCHNPVKKWFQFSSSAIGTSLKKGVSFHNIQSFFALLDSAKNEQFAEFFKEKVFLSGILTGGDQLNHLISFEEKKINNDQIKSYLEKVFKGKSKSNKVYELIKIYRFLVNGTELCYAKSGNVVLFSTSSILIEEAIRELKAEHHLAEGAEFKKLLKTADIDLDANLFVNYTQLGRSLSLYGGDNISFKNRLKNYGGWAEVDLNKKDKSLMLNGFSFITDSTFGYLNTFKGEAGQALNVTSVLPENTGAMTYISFTDFKSYKAKFDQYLGQNQTLYKHQKNISNINKKHSFGVEADFYSWIGDEMAVFTVNGDEASFVKNSALIIKTLDIEKAKEGLQQMHKSTGDSSEVIYQNFKLRNLGLINFFQLALGNQFKWVNRSNYVIIEDYVVFANDEASLKHIVNYYLRGKTLVKSIQFNKFYEQFSVQSNVFYYLNFRLSDNVFNHVLNEEGLASFNINKDSLHRLQAFGLQVNSNKNLFYTNAFINYNSVEESQNISLIEVKLDTSFLAKPWIVKNHYTKESEIIIQDEDNNLYLINNVGKILWKKSLAEKVIGQIAQVDRYKNNKLQYAFTTTNKIHQIDRNGNDVDGYPVKLKAPVTKGLAVLDYDNNRNYRLLITQGNRLHNFGVDGKQVKGWAFKPTSGAIAVTPQLLQIKKKDFIILSDTKGNVRALNRKGEDRIKMNTMLPPNTQNHYLWKNNALSNSGVLSTDSNGTIHFVKLSDDLETFSLKAFEKGFKLSYQDFNGDGVLDFVAIDDRTINVFKTNKKVLSTIDEIEFTPAYGVQSFSLGEKKSINIILDKAEGKVFGYNETGVLMTGFPIDGNSAALVDDIDVNGIYELIIGDKLGSVYIYSIGK